MRVVNPYPANVENMVSI